MKIAWIGTGVMGKEMLLHLHQAGYEVHAYNRTNKKVLDLKEKGIHVHTCIKECVQNVDIVITMVGFPHDVEEVYLCEQGILQQAKEGTICIDMTTSSPSLAQTLYEYGKEKKIHMLDAPVSGGDSGAKSATLSIMVGGDYEIFQQVFPILSCMGTTILHIGPSGAGQHCKAANQIAVAGAVAAMIEAIHYTKTVELNPEVVLSAIKTGAGGSWQLSNMAPRVLKNDLQPGFYIKHFLKDIAIIQEVMASYQTQLEMLDSVQKMYVSLSQDGKEDLGTQALIMYYEQYRKNVFDK